MRARVFNKTIIPLALVGYEMIIANSALRASLAIYHLISNARSWNNCLIYGSSTIGQAKWANSCAVDSYSITEVELFCPFGITHCPARENWDDIMSASWLCHIKKSSLTKLSFFEFYLSVYGPGVFWVHKHTHKRIWPMFSHLDRIDLVNNSKYTAWVTLYDIWTPRRPWGDLQPRRLPTPISDLIYNP